MRNSMRCLAFVVVGLAGCASNGSNDPFALRNPFDSERRFDPKSAPAANTQLATRAHTVGTTLIAEAKADLPERPVILTIGVKEPMIFHQRSGLIVLSDGLVERCATDEDLAAVICFELGKMAAEHTEKNPSRGESDMPPAPRLTSDVVGGAYSADMTRLAEEAKYDRRVPRAGRAREPRPDPKTLAENYYTRSGHNADDFARLEPLMKEAEENGEKREIMRGR
jgi:Peptidase family M48